MSIRKYCLLVCLGATLASSAYAGVVVAAPNNGATVSSPVQFVATGSSPACPKGVASTGIYTAPGVLAFVTAGSNLNTELSLSPGTYQTVVQEWDNCGWSSTTPITIKVGSGGQGVQVSAPSNGANVTSPVNFVATATSGCSKGVTAMGIYTAPNQLAYVGNGASLNANLTLSNGTYNTMVQEWDACGGSTRTPITITVGGGGGGRTFANLHTQAGWTGYALEPPGYGICDACKNTGPQTTWSWTQHVGSPSKSGNATNTTIGGQNVFSDVLWNNHLIGDFSSQGLPDTNHTLVPTLHNFTYDVWFYVGDVEISQALEFDINQFFGGKSFIWGHECRVAGGHEWDTWNNVTQHWVPSGVACNPISNSWNHLILQAVRTSDDHLLFKSITLNGNTANINRYDTPTPTNWYGVTINYQIDGNRNQQPYDVVLDNLNFTVQ
jgi:major membrane immunogen (membrane-anchored lipoprotein)